VDCDDSNQCTDDSCVPSSGCVFTPHTRGCSDGDSCTGPDSCDGYGHCIPGPDLPRWYRDTDDDGYGDPGHTICAHTTPVGYVGNDDDCCDSEVDVHPDQMGYFCSSFTCAGTSTPSWDYNCGGADIKRWYYQGDCFYDTYGYCTYWDGWLGSTIPACGVTASFITGCNYYCNPITAPRCQECI
jgi:hypothetical protein